MKKNGVILPKPTIKKELEVLKFHTERFQNLIGKPETEQVSLMSVNLEDTVKLLEIVFGEEFNEEEFLNSSYDEWKDILSKIEEVYDYEVLSKKYKTLSATSTMMSMIKSAQEAEKEAQTLLTKSKE